MFTRDTRGIHLVAMRFVCWAGAWRMECRIGWAPIPGTPTGATRATSRLFVAKMNAESRAMSMRALLETKHTEEEGN